LHNKCKPIAECGIKADLCKYDFIKTKPSTAQDDDNDNEEDDYALPSLSHQSSAESVGSADLISFDTATITSPPTESTTTTFANFSSFGLPFPSTQHKDDGFNFTEDMKFRVVNKDSGEVFDIRYDIDKTVPNHGNKMVVPSQLPLPPPPGSVRRPALSAAGDFDHPFFPTQATFPTTAATAPTSFSPSSSRTLMMPPPVYSNNNPTSSLSSSGSRPVLKPPMQIQGQGPPPLAISRMLSHEASFHSPSGIGSSLGSPNPTFVPQLARDVTGSSSSNHSTARDVKIAPKDPFSGLVDMKKP
jgi:hypothetical protein